jgi:hypothetical protein
LATFPDVRTSCHTPLLLGERSKKAPGQSSLRHVFKCRHCLPADSRKLQRHAAVLADRRRQRNSRQEGVPRQVSHGLAPRGFDGRSLTYGVYQLGAQYPQWFKVIGLEPGPGRRRELVTCAQLLVRASAQA